MLFSIATLTCVVLFALVGSYGLERQQRMGYLLRLKDRLRTEELEIANLQDPLTGIGNRRALARAIDRSARSGAEAVLLIDIDHFKAFNDTNGHQVGDTCLIRVAHSIASALRADDRVYRYGGEEFLVHLPEADANDAAEMAARIRASIAVTSIVRRDNFGQIVTISIGIAASSPSNVELNLASLIGRADEALYAAKRKGRDRIESLQDNCPIFADSDYSAAKAANRQ